MRRAHPALPTLLASALAALCLASPQAPAQGHATTRGAQQDATPESIGKRDRTQCATRQTAPDPRFETDRAWLGRIPLPWTLTDASGAVRAKGKLRYA